MTPTLLAQAAQAVTQSVPPVTGIPMLDGLLVSSPLAAVLLLWVRSLQREKDKQDEEHAAVRKGWEAERAAQMRQMIGLAETQVELSTTLRERLTLVERHLGLRNANGRDGGSP